MPCADGEDAQVYRHAVWRWPLAALLAVTCILSLASCRELRIEKVSVISGLEPPERLTVRLDVGIDAEAGGEDPAEPLYNQIGYLAVAVPPHVAVTGARLEGSESLVGPSGVRRMGRAPQLVGEFEREYVSTSDLVWHSFHVVVDTVDRTVRQSLAVEVDLEGVRDGETTLLVAPGVIQGGVTEIEPAHLRELGLVLGGGKALVMVVGSQGDIR